MRPIHLVAMWTVPLAIAFAGGNGAIAQEGDSQRGFKWVDAAPGEIDLMFDGRRVIRSMHAFDESTEERTHETYKVFHHVFDGAGDTLLTKGSGGLYTHHRGLFIGWNKLRLVESGEEFDFWHMTGVTQRLDEMLDLEGGGNSARQSMRIDWIGPEGATILAEQRTITVYRVHAPAILLLDFESQLTAIADDLVLDGDPEHAGFQFRATNAVAEAPAEAKATYLFHAERVDPREDLNLPWAAMRFAIDGRGFIVQHMNHPSNPEPTVYSAYRDYGRFGAFPKATIEQGETLTLRYRIYVERGEMPSREAMTERYKEYVTPNEKDRR